MNKDKLWNLRIIKCHILVRGRTYISDLSVTNLLDTKECDASAVFSEVNHPWEVLTKISAFIMEYAKTLPEDFEQIDEMVWLGKGTIIEINEGIKI